ncbi:hypothetical protein [Streptomonospora litoralis]|nr:hypothetical protein [Streptomonospora litoralis]
MRTRKGDPYLAGQHAGVFDLHDYVLSAVPDERMLADPEGRRLLTRLDPLLFAILYCGDLLRGPDGRITLADLHLALSRHGRRWLRKPGPRQERHAFVAPRESGKSSWVFKILPIWAAAHGHLQFIAAFSSSGAQAEKHVLGFRQQLDANPLLQEDYPALCRPARRRGGGTVSDSRMMLHTASGFSFTAGGLDSNILGLVDPLNRRPSLIVLDDVEPDEANYSPYQMDKRLTTLTDTVLPMNERAHVALVGTVVMAGSIVHQLVKTVTSTDDTPEWIDSERFRVHYYAPIVATPDGGERSIWPDKWPLDYLTSIRHTVSYRKNYENQPRPIDGTWWREEDIHVEPGLTRLRTIMTIDPAVTSKDSSDYTGFAVVSRTSGTDQHKRGQCLVHFATGRKIPHGEPMRAYVLALLESHPYVSEIVIETNQGGDLHEVALHDMPVPIRTTHTSAPKEVRFANLLQACQVSEVAFERILPEFEDQALAYPKVVNDDVIDAVTIGMEETVGRGQVTAVGGSWM